MYWKPIYHVLVSEIDHVIVGDPRDMRRRPGKKTDKLDADWISELLAHGLIAPSFVPPPHIAALRDLTRTRASLVQTRSQAKNRVHKILQDTNIKLSSVVTDLFGKSGRAMLEALVSGERDPKQLRRLGPSQRDHGDIGGHRSEGHRIHHVDLHALAHLAGVLVEGGHEGGWPRTKPRQTETVRSRASPTPSNHGAPLSSKGRVWPRPSDKLVPSMRQPPG